MSGDVDYPQGCQPITNCANVSQQIERLRHLAGCLYDCKPNNSEEVQQPNRFRRLFVHLSDDAFLNNSNSDFRVYLSLCLANILRVFQPECPTACALDLKNVYMYLFRTLRGLGEVTTDSPKFKNYFHLVEAIEKILHPLSEMKDFDDKEATPVFRSLIKEILSVPCGKGWQKDLRKDRLRMLRETDASTSEVHGEDDDDDEDAIDKIKKALITMGASAMSELDYVPNEILDVFFYHIIQPQKTNFPAACALAQEIIKTCMESENNPLPAAIRTILTTAGKEGRLPDEFELTGTNSRIKYFEVLRSLHHISHDLVSGAIEELNFWLQSENEAYRKEAVQIVGLITCDRNCQLGMDSNDATWTAFLAAASDSDSSVRLEFVKQAGNVLTSNHSHLRGQIINSLLRLSRDVQDEIRVEVVTAVTTVAKCKLEVISDKMLKACGDRMKDRKGHVRIHAIKHLMDLYTHVMTKRPDPYFSNQGKHVRCGETTSFYTESEKGCVRFIPNAVFYVYQLSQVHSCYHDSKLTIERYIQLNFIPYQIEPKTRCRVMMDLFRHLDDSGVIMFNEVIHRSCHLRRSLINILSKVDESGDLGVSEEFSNDLKERIRKAVKIFPDPQTLEKLFMTFVNEMAQNDSTFNRVKQLVKDIYTSEENVRAASALKESMRRKIPARHYDMFRHFIDRIAPVSFDTPTAKELVHQVTETVTEKIQLKKSAEKTFGRDLKILKIFTEHFTHLFTGDSIVEQIRATMLTVEEPKAVETALVALNHVFSTSVFRMRLRDEVTRKEKWFLCMSKDLKDLVLRTEPAYRRSCKLAARLLSCLLGKEKAVEHFDSIIETLIDRLDIESEGAANAFQVLSEMFRADMHHFLPALMDIIESDRIGPSLMTSPMYDVDDPVEFNDRPSFDKQPWPKYTMPKVYAMKFATRVLTALVLLPESEERKRMKRASERVIDLLAEIVENKGDFGGRQCELEKARLRSASAASLLKFACVLPVRPRIDARVFKTMSYLVIDESHCIRHHYVAHVRKSSFKLLPIEFIACYALVPLGLTEEEGENNLNGLKTVCRTHAGFVFADRTEARVGQLKCPEAIRVALSAETVIAYVVWLLANYPKLDNIEDNVEKTDSDEQKEAKLRSANQLAELQECLWFVIEALKSAGCNMQTVWRVLEKLKTCGDKAMQNDGGLSTRELRLHNKKIWALCDLGITMMLYRAKLQMEDQEDRDIAFNRQFFYVCTSRDKADPSNFYAPDVLVNDEKQRNGKLPKPKREFQVADLTAGFTPPPPDTTTVSAGSTTLKNVSRRRGNTTIQKKKATKPATRKRRSGGTSTMFESDEEDEEVEAAKKTSPKKPRGKRGVYDPPEDEDEEMEEMEEVMPVPKKRGAPAAAATNGTKNGTAPPKKRTSRQSEKSAQDSEEEEEKEEEPEEDVELDQLVLSPILDESSGKTRRSARTAKLTSSTPVAPPAKPRTAIKRKRGAPEPIEESEEEDEEKEDEEEEDPEEPSTSAPSPKKRTSGRRSAPIPSPARKNTLKKKPTPKKKAPVRRAPKRNKYGLSMEGEDEEENEEEEEKEEEEKEEEVEEDSGAVASTSKTKSRYPSRRSRR